MGEGYVVYLDGPQDHLMGGTGVKPAVTGQKLMELRDGKLSEVANSMCI